MIQEFKNVWDYLVYQIFSIASTKTLFNQYNCVNLECDLSNAAEIRRDNFKAYFNSFTVLPSVIIVGEAPSYLGMRFSGVPFTNEDQLYNGKLKFTGKRSSWGELRSSKTSVRFWNFMLPYHPKFLGWECILLHPHMENCPLSNRRPKTSELKEHSVILYKLYKLIGNRNVIAVGRSAEKTLKEMNIRTIYVTHPAALGKYYEKFEGDMKQALITINIMPC